MTESEEMYVNALLTKIAALEAAVDFYKKYPMPEEANNAEDN